MDQSQFQAYEVAGATDMNRLHQFPQDYFKEVVEGFIGDVSDALYSNAGFSSAIVAGPELEITVNAQTFAAGGRIGSVPLTVSNHPSSVPADTQRFYIYLDIQTTEVTESRDIANPGTGVKTPTNIVTHKTVAASVVVIERNQGDPEAPPPLGALGGGVERIGFIKLGYVDYNEVGVSNTDVFNSAAIFTAPGTPNLSLVSLDDLSDVSAAGPATDEVLQYNGANWVNVAVVDAIGDALRHVNDFRLSPGFNIQVPTDTGSSNSVYMVPYKGDTIALYNGTKYVLVRESSFATVNLAGHTADIPVDVFAYIDGGGNLAMELVDWASAIARSTSLTLSNGVWTKFGDETRRYIGTFAPDSATSLDYDFNRKTIYNYYNRVRVRALISQAGLSYNIPDTGGSYRQVNADPNNKIEMMIGIDEDIIELWGQMTFLMSDNGGAGAASGSIGIGFESTTNNNAWASNLVQVANGENFLNVGFIARTEYTGRISEGFRVFNWLEQASLSGGGTVNAFSGGGSTNTPMAFTATLLM